MMPKPRLLIGASGTPTGGGTGAAHIVECAQRGIIDGDVVGMFSNNVGGGVQKKASQLGVPFFPYPDIVRRTSADLVVFCGWTQNVYGLDPRNTIALERGHNAHATYFNAHMLEATALQSDIVIRFVTGPTVRFGPEIVRIPVFVDMESNLWRGQARSHPQKTKRELLAKVTKLHLREAQRHYFPQIINHVLWGLVSWDGVNASSRRFPRRYQLFTEPSERTA